MIRDALPADYPAVAELMRAFIFWHYDRHASDRAMIERYFDAAAFEAELQSLPGAYCPPCGALLVAHAEGRVIGCAALKGLAAGQCEMKRLFVETSAHGTGAGEALARGIVDRARKLGYTTMMLDTGPRQIEAQRLYHKLGFEDAEPYYEMSPELEKWLVFMKLDLTD